MLIKYIGKKEHGHNTFTRLTGILWFPGDVHEVKDEHAKVLLRHPDCFERVEAEAKKVPAQAPATTVTLQPGAKVETPPLVKETAAKKAPAKKAAAKTPRKSAKKA